MSKFPCLVLVGTEFPNNDDPNGAILDVQKVKEGEITVKSALVSIPITIGSDYLIVHFSQATGLLDQAHMLKGYDGRTFDKLINEPDLVIKYLEVEGFDAILYISGETPSQFLELWVVENLPEKLVLPTIDNFK